MSSTNKDINGGDNHTRLWENHGTYVLKEHG